MNWNNITVRQFQQIASLRNRKDIEEVEQIELLISIMYNIDIREVDDMPLPKFNKLGKQCGFLLTEKIPGKPPRYIRVGKRVYAMNYKPHTMKHRQYIEISQYAITPVEKMHLILASLVEPVKFGIRRKNNVKDHALYAEDMAQAKVTEVYHAMVFFCNLYSSSMRVMEPYLIRTMTETGVTESQARETFQTLINTLDGFTQPQ